MKTITFKAGYDGVTLLESTKEPSRIRPLLDFAGNIPEHKPDLPGHVLNEKTREGDLPGHESCLNASSPG